MDEQGPLQRQIGGAHYKKLAIQPVEFWLANDLGPIEAACVKYLSRWRDKGGVQDLRKVLHFLEILLDWARPNETSVRPHRVYITASQYCMANGIPKREEDVIDSLLRWRTSGISMLYKAMTDVQKMIRDEEEV